MAILTPIFEVAGIWLTRALPFIQYATDVNQLLRTSYPTLSNVFTATISTDSPSVTGVNLGISDGTVFNLASAAGGLSHTTKWEYTSSMSTVSGFNSHFSP